AYCVEKGIVAGVGDGKFDPDGKLSSAAFAKMLLVAIGTDGETFTGADWLQNVQAAAEKTILLYNLGDKVTTGSMERQKAAQMAFNAKFQQEANADKAKGDPRTMPLEVPETIKLFVIGHSYGNDCTVAYLWQSLRNLGVKNVTIGTLYYSGCRLRQHTDFILQNKAVYKYYKNTEGKLVTTKKTTFDKSINDEDWTHIMILSGDGHPDEFEPIRWQDYVIAYVRRTHPNAYLGYDMTWAYRADGNHSPSMQKSMDKYYGGDRMKMWQSLIDTTKNYGEGDARFKFVVPAGTTVMNAHTSFLGDSIYRDTTSHLNKGVGRYMAAMTVACTLTGTTPDQISYVPDAIVDRKEKGFEIAGVDRTKPGVREALEKVAKESVRNALAKPYEITQSQYTTAP
ncbi:MAG: DUF4886 domain-containing protein, partial [Oscillospiraceae bacterium]|nr:DUF4886 domain-containing protein [Oscillospiraceae bacterium]